MDASTRAGTRLRTIFVLVLIRTHLLSSFPCGLRQEGSSDNCTSRAIRCVSQHSPAPNQRNALTQSVDEKLHSQPGSRSERDNPDESHVRDGTPIGPCRLCETRTSANGGRAPGS